MDAIFGGTNGVPIITALDIGNRMGQRYVPGREPKGAQTYFCISTVKDIPRANVLSRKLVDLVETPVIPLDDVGTKIDARSIKLEPSIIIESSPSNFQYFYLMEKPITPGLASSVLVGLATAGLTDKGAIGASRVMRVPGSMNLKRPERPWPSRVTHFKPDRRFTPEEMAKAMGFTYGPAMKTHTPIKPLAFGEHDPYLKALEKLGMVRGAPSPSSGFIPITCPWEEEHTTPPVDMGTGYLPAIGGGAFHCFHSSCKDVHKSLDFKLWINASNMRCMNK